MSDADRRLDPSQWDPRDPSFRRDRIPWYRVLREQSAAHYHPEVGVVLSRYRDVGACKKARPGVFVTRQLASLPVTTGR